MVAIFKREFSSLFKNVTGWLFCGITLAVFGLYFYVYNLNYGYPYVAYSVSSMAFITLLLIPILTMKVISEERKNKVDQLLMCAPVSVYGIIFGKFMALAACFSISVGIIAISPLVLMTFGTVPLLETYVAILGFWLYGLTCIAIGMLASSITENQIVAAIISFLFLFLGFMMPSMVSIFGDNVFTKILGCYDISSPLDNFLNGAFDLTSLVYFVSLTLFALFISAQIMLKRKYSVSIGKLSISAFNYGMIILSVVLLVGINILINFVPEKYTAFDASSQQLYKLEEASVEYLKTLDEEIEVTVLASEEDADEYIVKTLNNMTDVSDKIHVDYIDTDKASNYALNYTTDSVTTDSLIVETEKRYKIIDYNDMYGYSIDYSTYSSYADSYDGEGQLISAFQYVLSDEMPVIYQLTGHNEMSLSGDFLSLLQKANYDIQSLNLLAADSIPDDAAALLILGPGADLSDDDLAKVNAYLENGGCLFLSLDYAYMSDSDDLKNIRSIMSTYNITAEEGIVADNDQNYYYSSPFYLLPYMNYSDMIPDYSGSLQVFIPGLVGLTYSESDLIYIEDLMTTSEDSVAKTDYKNATTYEYEDGDIMGPFSAALYVVGENNEQLAVFGSTEMLTDTADSYVAGRNSQVFASLISNMVESPDTDIVVIDSKPYSIDYLTISQGCIFWYGLIWGIVLPILSIIVGIIIWARRKRA